VSESPVREVRVAITADDFDGAVRFYRDALGLPVVETFDGGVILDAGRGTIEILSRAQAEVVDDVEVGRRVADGIRLALHVADADAAARALADAGAELLHEPVTTPWQDRNARLRAPDGTQLTLFTPPG
jgi:catechol 2,3-dioxygenase-like lactoylglutathione lyase family enzyme